MLIHNTISDQVNLLQFHCAGKNIVGYSLACLLACFDIPKLNGVSHLNISVSLVYWSDPLNCCVLSVDVYKVIESAFLLSGDMNTFTGYEPKAGASFGQRPAGQDHENQNMQSIIPEQSGVGRLTAQTLGAPAQLQDAINTPVASASGQLVEADVLGRDLSNIMEETLQSVEEFIGIEDGDKEIDAMVPSQEGNRQEGDLVPSGIGRPLRTS